MKTIIWFLGSIIFLLGLSYLLINGFGDNLLKDNLIVRVRGIDRNQIQINWVSESKTDTLLIFDKGQQVSRKIGKVGLNTFLLNYHNRQIASFHQFITSKLAMHDYVFEINEVNDSIFVDLQIFGPDQSL
jgi:hypothetical protein